MVGDGVGVIVATGVAVAIGVALGVAVAVTIGVGVGAPVVGSLEPRLDKFCDTNTTIDNTPAKNNAPPRILSAFVITLDTPPHDV
ncbi:MAG: hypothetical protein DMF30_00410 [Verrucomicrobia bacterium]|nr:MAG: hypothetical protein DMF30_00410 [Verrucomicrobiota bacterium]